MNLGEKQIYSFHKNIKILIDDQQAMDCQSISGTDYYLTNFKSMKELIAKNIFGFYLEKETSK